MLTGFSGSSSCRFLFAEQALLAYLNWDDRNLNFVLRPTFSLLLNDSFGVGLLQFSLPLLRPARRLIEAQQQNFRGIELLRKPHILLSRNLSYAHR